MTAAKELMHRLGRPAGHIVEMRRDRMAETTIRKAVSQLGFGEGYDQGSLRLTYLGKDWVLKVEDPLSDRVVGYGTSVRREHDIYRALSPDLRQLLPETHFNLDVPFILQERITPLSPQDEESRWLMSAAIKLCDAIPTLAAEDLTWYNAGRTHDGRLVFFDWELGVEQQKDMAIMGF